MSQIAVVPGSELDVHTPASSVRLDEGALNARYRGVRTLANAVENVGTAAEGIGEDLNKVRMAGITADADFRMRAAQNSFVQSTVGDQNEGQWVNRASETANQVKDDIYATHSVPPALRPQLDAAIRNWGQTLNIKAQTMAATQSISRASLAIKKSYDEAGRDGDAFGMANAVQLGRISKLDPVEMDQLEQGIPRTLALTAIENGLRENPAGTHDLLVSGASLPVTDQNGKPIVPKQVFKQKEFQGLVNAARVQTATWQSKNMEDLMLNAGDPITGAIPDDLLRQKAQAGEINPKAAFNRIASQDAQLRAKTEAERSALLREDRENVLVLNSRKSDPSNWGEPPELFAAELLADAPKIRNEGLRDKFISDVHRQVAAIKKSGQTSEHPVESRMMELIREDKSTQSAMVPVTVSDAEAVSKREGFLGFFKRDASPATTKYEAIPGGMTALNKLTGAEILDKFGSGAKDEDGDKLKESVIQAANLHAAKIKNDMHEWFKTQNGPKDTLFERANAYRQELERPYVMDTVRAALSKKAPAIVTTKDEFDALPKGAPFIHNGRTGTKN